MQRYLEPFQPCMHSDRLRQPRRCSAQKIANPFLGRKPLLLQRQRPVQNHRRTSSSDCSSGQHSQCRPCTGSLEVGVANLCRLWQSTQYKFAHPDVQYQSRGGIPSSTQCASTSDRSVAAAILACVCVLSHSFVSADLPLQVQQKQGTAKNGRCQCSCHLCCHAVSRQCRHLLNCVYPTGKPIIPQPAMNTKPCSFLSCATYFLQEAAMLAAPFAAINFESLKDLKKTFQSFSDKIYYGEVLPPVGSLSLSYSKFLDLLEARQVKRITILADGKVALVEVISVQD